ncbi:MAG: hypothetical protein HYR55_10400 [Acidobacteria bacterium]|nr:hypothetical protein [Acidobacteriota bacterium]MBI3658798.1 hypothetical protein [Acidobacteriota bacterium]
MANARVDRHLSEKEVADLLYEGDSASEWPQHLRTCISCQEALRTLQANLSAAAAEFNRQAAEGIDSGFYEPEARKIMDKIRSIAPTSGRHRLRWWPMAVATAAALVIVTMAISLYIRQRNYSRLWQEARIIVNQMGPTAPGANEFSSVFDDENTNPGFPVESEPQDLVGTWHGIN